MEQDFPARGFGVMVPSQPDRPFHGLWSLWEMLELKAGAFYEATMRLSALAAWIDATTHVGGEAREGRAYHKDTPLGDVARMSLLPKLNELKAHIELLGAKVTLIATNEATDFLKYDWATWGHAGERIQDIQNSLRRELSTITVLVLEDRERTHYADGQPFGEAVAAKFPTEAAFEADEASKCLGLGRSTAAVFHLMRVMEIAIRSVTRCLGASNPVRADRNWGNILKAIKADFDSRGGTAPTKAWLGAADKDLFESAYVSLDAVRVAWRNPTMHVEKKYTTEQAEHIFIAVEGFMRQLASRCDEDGEPKA